MRFLAWSAVCAGMVAPLARRRLRTPVIVTAVTVAAAPLGLAVAVPRSRKRDVGIYVLQLWAFMVIHELPNERPERLEQRTRIDYPIACDRVLGLGEQPTLRLQRTFGRPGRTRTLDHTLVWVHWLWFFEPHAVAAWMLWRHPERFTRTAVMMSSLFHLGCVVYLVIPTAPPWWAGEKGRMPGVRRIMVEVGERTWGSLWRHLYDFLGGNPVAAMPSLHLASSVMAAHILSETGGVEGTFGWAYAGVLGFGLVYLGEHYVVDLLAGVALTEAIRLLGPRAVPVLMRASGAIEALEARARMEHR